MMTRKRDTPHGKQLPLTIHLLLAAGLALSCLFLGLRLLHNAARTRRAVSELVTAQASLATARLAADRLSNIGEKISEARLQTSTFYVERFPYADSDIAYQLGRTARSAAVTMSRASYVHVPSANGLTGVYIDLAVAGNYVSVARFINELERSKTFFLITNVALASAEQGKVNAKVHLETYIREPMPSQQQRDGR